MIEHEMRHFIDGHFKHREYIFVGRISIKCFFLKLLALNWMFKTIENLLQIISVYADAWWIIKIKQFDIFINEMFRRISLLGVT